ncbi:MAG: family 78 glycoside hydrolase catalytic domain [bacterium]
MDEQDKLKTEHAVNPLGIDVLPRFSWSQDGAGGQRAYRLLAASDEGLLRRREQVDVWDSGRVERPDSCFVPYGGKTLKSGQRVYWQVQTWNEQGLHRVSEIAWFEMGLLSASDWQGVFMAPKYCGTGGRGYHSAVLKADQAGEFWVQIDLGRNETFDRIVLFPCYYREQGESAGPGFGFPVSFRIETSDHMDGSAARLVYMTDQDIANPGLNPVEVRPLVPAQGRFVRLTVITPFNAGKGARLLALDEFQIFMGGTNLALGKSVSVSNQLVSSVRAGTYDWHADCLTDGIIHVDEPRHNQGDGNLLRRLVEINKPIVRARVYVGSRGWYELRFNQQKAGDAVLDSAWTSFEKRVLYSVWDVTDLLKQGVNVVTLLLGSGWSWQPAVILQLQVDHPDGSQTVLCSDDRWRVLQSPVIESHVYHGETYDARLERSEIFDSKFDDSDRPQALTFPEYRPALSAQMQPPIRVAETVAPVAVCEPQKGVWVFDLGQNIAGWVRLRVKGGAGQQITLRFAECIFDDGTVWTDEAQTKARQAGRLQAVDGMLNTANNRSARVTDRYICAGGAREEIWEPRFTYHGFRFVEMTGYAGRPDLNMIEGRVVHTDVASIGQFECSNEVLNWAQQASRWTLLNNLHSLPTDCCQRDERQGWMADAHLVCEAMLCNFDAASTYGKWLQDIRDDQRADGAVGDTTPYTLARMGGDVAWGCATILVPWEVYLHTGDIRVLEQHWDSMRRYMEFLDRSYPTRFVDNSIFGGDWLAIEETPHQLTHTGFLLLSARTTARVARILGQPVEAERWKKMERETRTVFHQSFFDPATSQYGNAKQFSQTKLGLDANDNPKNMDGAGSSQFANSFALYLGVVPENLRSAVFAKLVANIESRLRHLSTGVLGTKYLLETLGEEGRADLALAVITAPDFPGYGYMRAHQATTLWEHWSLKTGSGMNSHDHPWMASVSAWMLKYLAGLRPAAEQPGFGQICFRPQFPQGLQFASGKIETRQGLVSASWRRRDETVRLELRVPAGCSGNLSLPSGWRLQTPKGDPSGKITSAIHADSISLSGGTYTMLLEQITS